MPKQAFIYFPTKLILSYMLPIYILLIYSMKKNRPNKRKNIYLTFKIIYLYSM